MGPTGYKWWKDIIIKGKFNFTTKQFIFECNANYELLIFETKICNKVIRKNLGIFKIMIFVQLAPCN